jgi:chorismate mutase
MEHKELLQIYRDQIDTLDKEIIYLLTRRFQIVNEIWILKKENNIDALQNDVWNKLISDHIAVWKEIWLWEWIIKDIWNRIHIESLEIEKS